MNVRSRLQRQARERRYVSINGVTYRRGQRFHFRAVHPDHGVLFSGWFVADSNNPVVHVINFPPPV